MENIANETEVTTEMVENLQKELERERRKNRNLSNQNVRLGEALDAALRACNDRMEADMIDIVNANNDNRKAREEKAAKVRAYDKKLSNSYMRACTLNAAALVSSVILAVGTIFLGHTGIINPNLATVLAAVFLPLVGWAAHDCKILFQFAESIRG